MQTSKKPKDNKSTMINPAAKQDDENIKKSAKISTAGQKSAPISPMGDAAGGKQPSVYDPDGDGDDDSSDENPDLDEDEAGGAAAMPPGRQAVASYNASARKSRKVADPHGIGDFIDRIKGDRKDKAKAQKKVAKKKARGY